MVFKIYGLYEPDGTIRYIGYTSKTLSKRLYGHLNIDKLKGQLTHKMCWIRSLKKKGLLPIIRELDTATTLEEAHLKEIYLIALYKKNGADLVNRTEGGDGQLGVKRPAHLNKQNLKVHQYNLKGKLLNTYISLSEAAEKVGDNRNLNGKVSGVCKGYRRTFFGYVFRYDGDAFNKYPTTGQYKVTNAQKEALSIRQTLNNVMKNRTGELHPYASAVVQYTRENKFVEEYPSIADAIRATGIKNISQAASTNGTSGGFKWVYKNKDIVRSSEKSENSN